MIQASRLMPILWLFVRFLKKAGGFAGPPALQWVYSILAFCRGQGKRRAPAVQTLVLTLLNVADLTSIQVGLFLVFLRQLSDSRQNS